MFASFYINPELIEVACFGLCCLGLFAVKLGIELQVCPNLSE